MIFTNNFFAALLFSLSLILLNSGLVNPVYAFPKNTPEQPQQPGSDRIYGKVTDIVDVSGYTYAEVSDGENKIWAAGPVTPLKVGDMIAFTTDMPMENYHSKTLERDFAVIYFVEQFITDKVEPADELTATASATASPHEQIKQGQAGKTVSGINKAEGGNTIAEIYSQKLELKGKTIRVRGQVTKVTKQVMGKNWLHIMDSSTQDDLTVTTQDTAEIDEVVIIEGKLQLDKDYSYGYVYPVIVEDANLVKE